MTEVQTAPAPQPADEYAGYEDYWGTDETTKHFLKDGKQFFVIQPMNEGSKTKFQKMTNQDVVLEQKSGNARLRVDPATERHELIKASVVDWHLVQRNNHTGQFEEIRFTPDKLTKWLQTAPPHVVSDLEHAIRLANPWLQADMTLEDIDEEMDRLRELRKQKEAEELGESGSATK
jgi:hypothetical protein